GRELDPTIATHGSVSAPAPGEHADGSDGERGNCEEEERKRRHHPGIHAVPSAQSTSSAPGRIVISTAITPVKSSPSTRRSDGWPSATLTDVERRSVAGW